MLDLFVPFPQHVPCRSVLGRAWKCSQSCPVRGVMRDYNTEEEREGKDKIWMAIYSRAGKLPYMTAGCAR